MRAAKPEVTLQSHIVHRPAPIAHAAGVTHIGTEAGITAPQRIVTPEQLGCALGKATTGLNLFSVLARGWHDDVKADGRSDKAIHLTDRL